jgi:cell shape-determining protein MreC
VKWRSELLTTLALLVLLGAISFAHLAWNGQPLLRLLHHNFYVLLGGRVAAVAPSDQPDPLLTVLGEENERLHQLLALRSRLPGVAQAAKVVRREPDTWWTQLEVEFVANPADLPATGTAIVLTPQGLIGTLESDQLVVIKGQAQAFYRGTVALLSSPETQLSVVVGEEEAPFLLEGKGGLDFALRPVVSGAENAIAAGDSVLTSGLGQLYSKGLQVGTVGKDSQRATFSTCASTPDEVLLWWRQ